MSNIIEKLGITQGPWKLDHKRYFAYSEKNETLVLYPANGSCDDMAIAAAAPEMLEALICQRALDMKSEHGYKILESFGWSYRERFTLSATEFVSRMTDKAIEKATDGKIKELINE